MMPREGLPGIHHPPSAANRGTPRRPLEGTSPGGSSPDSALRTVWGKSTRRCQYISRPANPSGGQAGRTIAVEQDSRDRYTPGLEHDKGHALGAVPTEAFASETLMRLTFIDRILELAPGERIKAAKCLSLTEDYLKDHFPFFPIMPGVLMLEAMYQTAAWLVRATDNFHHSLVTLSEVNNVKYSDFVEPGQTLLLTAELLKHTDNAFRLQCLGEVQDRVAVRGRLVLQVARLSEKNPQHATVDEYMIRSLRRKFRILYPNGWAEASQASG